MIALIVIAVIVILIALFVMGTYNGLVKSRNSIEEAFSTMDVYLKKRFDLIPNLVETVKGYAKHESQTLENVIAMRNAAGNAATMQDRMQAEGSLSGAVRNIFALAENYPDLKANTNFLDLQNQLGGIENDIANSRKYYNAVVKEFNNKCEMFPSSIIANMFGFKKAYMYEVADAAERENVRVSF